MRKTYGAHQSGAEPGSREIVERSEPAVRRMRHVRACAVFVACLATGIAATQMRSVVAAQISPPMSAGTTIAANATGASFTPVATPTPGGPKSVAVADLVGDGHPDVAVGDNVNDRVLVLAGRGDGSFDPEPAAVLAVAGDPYYVEAHDLDGDQIADLAVATNDANTRQVDLFRNLKDENGTFGTPVTLNVDAPGAVNTAGEKVVAVVCVDLDSDGLRDIVATNREDDTVSVFANTSTSGTLSVDAAPAQVLSLSTDAVPHAHPWAAAAGNLDTDPALEVAVVTLDGEGEAPKTNPGSIRLLDNDSAAGAPALRPAGSLPVQNWPYWIAIGDLDRNGVDDLAVANSQSLSVTTYRHTGNTGFAYGGPQHHGVGSVPKAVAIGDFDLDGWSDLAVANHLNKNITLLLSDDTQPVPNLVADPTVLAYPDVLQRPVGMRTADLDGDHDDDLVVGSPTTTAPDNSTTVSFLNTGS